MPSRPRRLHDTHHAFATEAIGRLATTSVPIVFGHETVGDAHRRFRTMRYEYGGLIIVTDAAGRYLGVVEPGRLLAAAGDERLSSLTHPSWPTVEPQEDQERAAERASAARVGVLPVVAGDGTPVGVAKPEVLLDVLAREHREDMHRLVGMLRERAGARHALEDPPLRRVARRLPWLLVGLALSAAATGIMAGFEGELEANIVIAFFIPALVYLTDAIGTQTEAIAVRGLSLRKKPLPFILAMEILTGGLIGLALGVIAFLGVWLVFGSPIVGFGVGLALCVAGTIASAIGLVLPWALSRLGMDPAFGSGPVATIIQDTLTILTYFVIMTALLPGAMEGA
jgi:magnesium transporter